MNLKKTVAAVAATGALCFAGVAPSFAAAEHTYKIGDYKADVAACVKAVYNVDKRERPAVLKMENQKLKMKLEAQWKKLDADVKDFEKAVAKSQQMLKDDAAKLEANKKELAKLEREYEIAVKAQGEATAKLTYKDKLAKIAMLKKENLNLDPNSDATKLIQHQLKTNSEKLAKLSEERRQIKNKIRYFNSKEVCGGKVPGAPATPQAPATPAKPNAQKPATPEVKKPSKKLAQTGAGLGIVAGVAGLVGLAGAAIRRKSA